jgi:hypothetical protein
MKGTLIFLHNIIAIFLLSSCVWKYVTPAHNTPCFTNKKQFEGTIGGNINGGNVNLAYSPIKYLSLQVNGYSSFNSKTKSVFNNQLEAAVGAYLPMKRIIAGLNVGYGLGATNWDRTWSSGDVYTPLKNLQFDTKKYFIQYYTAIRWSSHESFSGLSAKVNFMENNYRRATYSYDEVENFTCDQYSFELAYFIKLRLNKSIFINFNWGAHVMQGFGNKEYDIHPIGQIGLTFKH